MAKKPALTKEEADQAIKDLIAFIEKERDEHVATLGAEIQTLRDKHQSSENLISEKNNEISALKKKVKDLEDEIKTSDEAKRP